MPTELRGYLKITGADELEAATRALVANICLELDCSGSMQVEKAEAAGLRYHVGNMLSSDIFYHLEPGMAGYGRLPDHGVLGVEMESAALYTLAARFGRKALTVCAMTDSLVNHEYMSAEDRQSSLKEMVTLALDVAIG